MQALMRRALGFSLLEFAIVVLIISGVVYALIPRVSDSLKLAHETVVWQTAAALQESLKLVQLKYKALAVTGPVTDLVGAGDGRLDLNAAGYPIGTAHLAREPRPLQTRDCEAIWYGVLAGLPPSAAIIGNADFRVQTHFDRQHGLGCAYRYQRGGNMTIHYYPDNGSVVTDGRF